MPATQFERFRDVVLADPDLQADLQLCLEGDFFVAEVVRLAAIRGFSVEAGEVGEAIRVARRSWLERWL